MLLVVSRFGDLVRTRLEIHIEVAADRRSKGREQPVIIGLRDRIELVIVAASATDGEAEHGATHRCRHVVEGVVSRSLDLVGGDLRWKNARAEEAGGLQGQRVLRLK